jgi:8-oxo-dGTP pyrophosphatase MutT (NUDIX family)
VTRARIRDPHAVPVVGTDGHLPALDGALLDPQLLRQRFAAPETFDPEHPGDGDAFATDLARTQAAVLVPLVQRDNGLHVLLTRRTDHLRDHAGQISFPGGRSEPEEGSPEATALREAQEEVGLDPRRVEVIGQMPVYTTVTGYVVTPVVALVQTPLTLTLDSFEVAESFEVPLPFLMNPANHRRHQFDVDGRQRQFLSMPWQGQGSAGVDREFFIWGATAAMLRNLYRFLAP